MPQQVIVISGATATGKSAMAIKLAQRIGGVIINADALQLYRGLPILSAQPSKEEQQMVPHRLYGYLDPFVESSVGNWLTLVSQEVQAARAVQAVPIIVGGSGMYIARLIKGTIPIPAIETAYAQASLQKLTELGLEQFRKLQQQLDPQLPANYIDKQRLTRAYEVYLQTGRPISYWLQQANESLFATEELQHFNLSPPREKIYENCNVRFQQMLDNEQTIQEVKALSKLFCAHLHLPLAILDYGNYMKFSITKTIGLREIAAYLRGELDRQSCYELAAQNTRHYAKRQLTWFRHQFVNTAMINLETAAEIWQYF